MSSIEYVSFFSQETSISHNSTKSFQFNVTLIVDVHVVGIYFKVHRDAREENL
jgi:hypothetical protein